jgi:hypothetical protein
MAKQKFKVTNWRNYNKAKLLSKFDKKTKLIIHGVLFLMIFWGLKWGATT